MYPEQQEEGLSKQPLDANSLNQLSEGLASRIKEAELKKEEDIKKGLSKHDILMLEANKNRELFNKAKEVLDFFVSAEQFDRLDDEGKKKLDEIKETIGILEKRQLEIKEELGGILKIPEVATRIGENAFMEDKDREDKKAQAEELAKKEDVQQMIKNLKDKAHAELDPQIDELAESIKKISERETKLIDSKTRQEKESADSYKEIKNIFSKECSGKEESFLEDLNTILSNTAPEELVKGIEEFKKSLRFYELTKKNAVDRILSNHSVFDQYSKVGKNIIDLQKQQEDLKTEMPAFTEKYEEILRKSWGFQGRISEIDSNNRNEIPFSLDSRLTEAMKRYADVRRIEKGMSVGKYDGWFEANSNEMKNRILFHNCENIVKNSSVTTYDNPNKLEDKK